jgi:hypothetical protein
MNHYNTQPSPSRLAAHRTRPTQGIAFLRTSPQTRPQTTRAAQGQQKLLPPTPSISLSQQTHPTAGAAAPSSPRTPSLEIAPSQQRKPAGPWSSLARSLLLRSVKLTMSTRPTSQLRASLPASENEKGPVGVAERPHSLTHPRTLPRPLHAGERLRLRRYCVES